MESKREKVESLCESDVSDSYSHLIRFIKEKALNPPYFTSVKYPNGIDNRTKRILFGRGFDIERVLNKEGEFSHYIINW